MSSPSASESCLPGRTDTPDRICGYNRIRKPIEKPLPFSGDGKSAAMTGRALLLFRSYPPRIVVVLFLFRFAGGGGARRCASAACSLPHISSSHCRKEKHRFLRFFAVGARRFASSGADFRLFSALRGRGGRYAHSFAVLSLRRECDAQNRTTHAQTNEKRHLHPREAGNRCPFPCVRKHRESKADPFYRTSVFRRHKHGGQRIQ